MSRLQDLVLATSESKLKKRNDWLSRYILDIKQKRITFREMQRRLCITRVRMEKIIREAIK